MFWASTISPRAKASLMWANLSVPHIQDGAYGGTLDNNTVTKSVCEVAAGVPESGSTLLQLGSGVAGLLALKRRFR